ncbi:RlmE family RNA methyltransferase [Varunaivibrio sulfuroxidans]|uniref:Ribosomal RNA large subunit methyltransferase E n=1 Tax=Varunaivibrio sulfuroxidans TaxID=1773489 RepID=A0A4R3JBG5_9PROT|nr:RlmE family RNA methyltransferase [Varunaivibrio sulfuroxidans]TCS62967.1 23S rRNA Um-2552 2'-O-methyltransferase [Varunaivibrio sulfuroxidans]WES31955.1 RlmE family RNA methyltransferase [Varunaivibrio sulfuroxidans]
MSKKPSQGRKSAGGSAAQSGGAGRDITHRVKSAKGRKTSSTRWLQRQLNDPYVHEAKRRGYRSRAAFKLIELDDRFKFLKPGSRVLDLGAAPGGWTQVAIERIKPSPSGYGGGKVVAIDIQEMDPLPGADCLHMDFMDDDAPERLKTALGGAADVVMSDMAAPATGHPGTDHLRIMALCETALDFALQVLAPEGVFLAKVFQGGSEQTLLAQLKKDFKTVKHAKPPASRSGSAEMYVIALGFRGIAPEK